MLKKDTGRSSNPPEPASCNTERQKSHREGSSYRKHLLIEAFSFENVDMKH
jgi:hypothetical protein